MHITPSEHTMIANALIIVILVLEFGAVLLSVRSRSLFGFFTTLAAFTGTIGIVLMINSARDWAGHFTKYQTIKGVPTWRASKTLFWANIDPSFIEAFIAVAIICAVPATILFALGARRNDKRMKHIQALEAELAELKNKGKRPAAKTTAPSESTSPKGETTTEDAKSKRQKPNPESVSHEAASLA